MDSTGHRRQALYAALLRYTPETGPLRERALDRVVLGALLGSTKDRPLRVGEIRERLHDGVKGPAIRTETLQGSLGRLREAGKVGHTERLTRHAYFILEAAEREVDSAVAAGAHLFQSAVGRMLEGTGHAVAPDVATLVCHSFISEAFAKCGSEIAQMVTGRITHDELVRSTNLRGAFAAAVQNVPLGKDAIELLEARCLSFVRSKNPDDERLKFFLTQGYYFVQLLGYEDGKFDPLSERAFSGAVFYLDTNLVIARILLTDGMREMFNELARVSKKLGFELRVTRATINEARRVAASKADMLRRIVGRVPAALTRRTDDDFLNEFVAARVRNPGFTVDEFVAPLDHAGEVLAVELGVAVDERIEDDMLSLTDCAKAQSVINEESVAIHAREKSSGVLAHDLGHYALVCYERRSHPKTWFLTQDGALIRSAQRLAASEPPFCFSLAGLLQSLSPFIDAGETAPFVETFSSLVFNQALPMEQVYDARELLVLADLHDDVKSTPEDQIVQAYEHVRQSVLHGKAARHSDLPAVALGIRTFLSSTADERERTLRADAARSSEERQGAFEQMLKERELREAAERRRGEESDVALRLARENDALRAGDQERKRELEAQGEEVRIARRNTAAVVMAIAVPAGIASLLLQSILAQWGASTTPWLAQWTTSLATVVAISGIALMVLPVAVFIRRTLWKQEVRLGLITVVAAAAFAISRLVDDQTSSVWSSFLQLGSTVALLIVPWVRERTTKQTGMD
jgi:hypothetical protein